MQLPNQQTSRPKHIYKAVLAAPLAAPIEEAQTRRVDGVLAPGGLKRGS